MKTIKLLKKQYLLVALMLLSGVYLQAQVTTGEDVIPQSFSALEIVSNGEKGLRLPQMSTDDRDNLVLTFGAEATNKAKGLMIFNTDTKCVDTWNGNDWISLCDRRVSAINLNGRHIFPITSALGSTYDLNELVASVEPFGAINSVTWEVLSATGTDVTVELNGSNITFYPSRVIRGALTTTVTVKATAADGGGTYIVKELFATTGTCEVRGSSSCIYTPVYSGQYPTGLEGIGMSTFCYPPYFELVSKPEVKLRRYVVPGSTESSMTWNDAKNFCYQQGMRPGNLAEVATALDRIPSPGMFDTERYWTSTPASATEQWGYNYNPSGGRVATKVSNTDLGICICVFEGPHIN